MQTVSCSDLLPSLEDCRRGARLNRLTLRGSSPEAEFAARWSTEGGDYCVYCLAEAGKRIRYIGITNQRVGLRLAQHLADCGRGKNIHKENWLRSCAKRNVEVTIHVVRSGLTAQQAGMVEEMLIKLLKKPFRLTNSHAGGSTGYAGLSDESRAKHRLNTKTAWARLIERELEALDMERGYCSLEDSESDDEHGETGGLKLISVSRPMIPPPPEAVHPVPSGEGERRVSWEDDLIRTIRGTRLSLRTEQAYRGWAARFAAFVAPRAPDAAVGGDVAAFLTSLAVHEGVSRASQLQALSAVMFLMQDALLRDVGEIEFREAADRQNRRNNHAVLSQKECGQLFTAMAGTSQVMATLMYSAGLRLHELLKLRVHHLDIEQRRVRILGANGGNDRTAVFSEKLAPLLRRHLDQLYNLWGADREMRLAGVWLPEGLAAKDPKAGAQWEWQWLFPSRTALFEPKTGVCQRHPVSDAMFQVALKSAGKKAGLRIAVTPRMLRLSCAVHMLNAGLEMRTLRDLLGHPAVGAVTDFIPSSAQRNRDSPSGERADLSPMRKAPKRERSLQPDGEIPF